jgi:hypothetical protein
MDDDDDAVVDGGTGLGNEATMIAVIGSLLPLSW